MGYEIDSYVKGNLETLEALLDELRNSDIISKRVTDELEGLLGELETNIKDNLDEAHDRGGKQ